MPDKQEWLDRLRSSICESLLAGATEDEVRAIFEEEIAGFKRDQSVENELLAELDPVSV
jgi:hypothetical protein